MRRVITAAGEVPIGDLESGALERTAFLTPRELEELDGRPARTIAGRIALKGAAIALFAELTGEPRPATDFEFLREEGGSTVPLALPELPAAARVIGPVRCSISHTASDAYAMAAVEVDDGR